MRAIFIAVGSEMLDKERVDTNSIYVARRLMEVGILTDMKMVVGDDIENLTWAIKNACKRAQIVIVTGGLGPTEDDITREAAAFGMNAFPILSNRRQTQTPHRFSIYIIEVRFQISSIFFIEF